MSDVMIQIAKKILKSLGVDVRRYSIAGDQAARMMRYFNQHDIECILDVGANIGQFGLSVMERGFKGKIISFEPIPSAHAELLETAKKYGERWVVAPRMALSTTEGKAKFNVAANSVSSSLKSPSGSLLAEGIDFNEQSQIDVDLKSLDIALAEQSFKRGKTFLKLDVQGGELDVLKGSKATLPTISGVLSEMSTVALYDDQGSYLEVDAFIRNSGFDLWDLEPGFRNQSTSRLLQFDAIYFRSEEV